MIITSVEVKNFRNYKQFSLFPHPKLNFIFGANGAGKTSILESIYCALQGCSFKPFTQNQFIKDQEKEAQTRIKLQEEDGSSEVLASFFKKEQGKFQKKLQYGQKPVRASFLIQKIPLLIFTEEKMKIIRQGPEARRYFIDCILKEEGYDFELKNFYKILKQKQKLLRDYKKDCISFAEMDKVLQVLEPQFLKASQNLVKARLQILIQMFEQVSPIIPHFFPKPYPALTFQYQIHPHENDQNSNLKGILEAVAQDLKGKRDREIQAGLSLSGPHKHDLVFIYNGHNSRNYCSQGQQRSYLLSLFGGRAKNPQKRLLFLDDVLMELDPRSQKNFLTFLEEIPSQIFLTHCEKNTQKIKNMSSFYVKNGIISLYHDRPKEKPKTLEI